MTYRDDLDAAQARAEAAERENEELKARLADSAPPAPFVPLPAKFNVDDAPGALTISWRWFEPRKHISALLFCLAWSAFLVFWYTTLSQRGPWIFTVFPLIFVIVGVVLAYTTLAGFLNRTVITVNRDRLTVTHGPLPWLGSLEMPRGRLKQLYVTKKDAVTRYDDRQMVSTTYDLCAIDEVGRQHRLLDRLPEAEQARYLEAALEKRLGIVNEPVAGELPR